MITRLSKSLCVCAIALFISLAVFNNLTDYATNFTFIQHVLSMDSIFPNATVDYRAINATLFHHVAYIMIIIIETICALICWYGGITLLKNCKKSAFEFNRSKKWSIAGLTLAFLLWHVAFISIGGEWFAMWMSKEWNSIQAAFRFYITALLVLIYVALRDHDESIHQ
ncbi:DUF2165 domain-containing protein [Providencia stuartii]|uniref:DUF2165 family protein n=1 Tax=Providencia TaxID=586 RepID=UPI0027FB6148|nr:DUF2165 domain-containing protein [Providencia sp. 2023EL-00965]ELR5299509.1 DUF2165 domain-containing protein [Providencia stuartii]ELR5302730.1 DUF2165 domain-containing protein [Providencia stuartii]MDW7588720.1 DUF2165 domain-containing protein [Providencia sp. 2023EL-00965]